MICEAALVDVGAIAAGVVVLPDVGAVVNGTIAVLGLIVQVVSRVTVPKGVAVPIVA
jgi:hypothetical protein